MDSMMHISRYYVFVSPLVATDHTVLVRCVNVFVRHAPRGALATHNPAIHPALLCVRAYHATCSK